MYQVLCCLFGPLFVCDVVFNISLILIWIWKLVQFSRNETDEPNYNVWTLLVILYSVVTFTSILRSSLAIVTCFCHEMKRKIRISISFVTTIIIISSFVSMAFVFKDTDMWKTELPIGVVGAFFNVFHLFLCPFFHLLLHDGIPDYDDQIDEASSCNEYNINS